MGIDRSTELSEAAGETYCKRHPDVETALLCGRCGTPICPRCLVQTPVGARCPDCANTRRIPTVDVQPQYIVRGVLAGIVAGAVIGFLWAYVTGDAGFRLGFLSIFLGMGIGWAISEAISVATNRKRGTTLAACAVGAAILAYVVHNLVNGVAAFPQGDLMGYLTAGIAAYFGYSRLNY